MHFVYSEYDSEKGSGTHFKRKLTNYLCFQRILSMGLLSTNLKRVMDASFTKESTASFKKNGEMNQR